MFMWDVVHDTSNDNMMINKGSYNNDDRVSMSVELSVHMMTDSFSVVGWMLWP